MRREAGVELRVANEADTPCLEALLDAYLGELDGGSRSGGPGARRYRYLDLYWTEPERHPFFIETEGEAVGFVFVRDVTAQESVVHRVAEFYVKPAKRRLGIGQSAALALWRRFPGRWALEVETANSGAIRFWRSCIEAATQEALRTPEARPGEGRLEFDFVV